MYGIIYSRHGVRALDSRRPDGTGLTNLIATIAVASIIARDTARAFGSLGDAVLVSRRDVPEVPLGSYRGTAIIY